VIEHIKYFPDAYSLQPPCPTQVMGEVSSYDDSPLSILPAQRPFLHSALAVRQRAIDLRVYTKSIPRASSTTSAAHRVALSHSVTSLSTCLYGRQRPLLLDAIDPSPYIGPNELRQRQTEVVTLLRVGCCTWLFDNLTARQRRVILDQEVELDALYERLLYRWRFGTRQR
jgi:hypothetical protein